MQVAEVAQTELVDDAQVGLGSLDLGDVNGAVEGEPVRRPSWSVSTADHPTDQLWWYESSTAIPQVAIRQRYPADVPEGLPLG